MTTIHLGVLDLPYQNNGQTTAEVADILEEHYGVIGAFYALHEQEIADSLSNSILDSIENLEMGAPITNPFSGGTEKIDSSFRHFLDTEEIATLGVPGVPTQAALKGKSKRFKKGKGARRPSFIDTGLYEKSFTSWVEA